MKVYSKLKPGRLFFFFFLALCENADGASLKTLVDFHPELHCLPPDNNVAKETKTHKYSLSCDLSQLNFKSD